MPDFSWMVVYTKPRQERVALENLVQQGFDAYLPLYKVLKKSKPGERAAQLDFEPMFARYLFFKPTNPAQSITVVRSTKGVASIVRFSSEPAVVKSEVLQAIRELEHFRNSADLAAITPFQPGAPVRLRHGAWQGIEGLVQAASKQRVNLLVEILGRPTVVQVGHNQMELVKYSFNR